MKVLVLRGIPGCGKSTLALGLRKELEATHSVVVVSADDYFMRDGKYNFNPLLLSEAHGTCFRLFMQALMFDEMLPEIYAKTLLIVDNTNITTMEISPYMLGAQAANVPAALHSMWEDPSKAAKQTIHGVPEVLTWRMAHHYLDEDSRMPVWWRKLATVAAVKEWLTAPAPAPAAVPFL